MIMFVDRDQNIIEMISLKVCIHEPFLLHSHTKWIWINCSTFKITNKNIPYECEWATYLIMINTFQ